MQRVGRVRRLLLKECESDCDSDSDCAEGLLCADVYKKELKALGLDPRKADCDPATGPETDEVCFKEGLLSLLSTGLEECSPVDCDSDSDCAPGFLCADGHKNELKAKGFDERKAACGPVGANNQETCFKEDLLDRELCPGLICQSNPGLLLNAFPPFSSDEQISVAECIEICATAKYAKFASQPPPIFDTPNLKEVYANLLFFAGGEGSSDRWSCRCSEGCTGFGATPISSLITAKGVGCNELTVSTPPPP